MKKLLLKTMLLLCALVVGSASVWADNYNLVKNVSELSEGDVILIASGTSESVKALGAQNTNNRAAASVSVTSEVISSLGEAVELTLDTKDASGNYTLKSSTGYLYAANSSSGKNNYLKEKNSKVYWSIEINASTYVATIKDEDSSCNGRNWLRFNSNSDLFSCYNSGQNNVYIYKKEVVVSAVATPTFSVAGGTYTTTQSVELNCATDGATIRYTLDGTEPTESSTAYSSAIAVSTTTTIKAIAYKGEDASNVATATYTILPVLHEGTAADPYTVADARNAIDANTGLTDVYVSGIVCEGGSSFSSGAMNYWISDDGSETDKFEIYKGKGLDGANFTATSDVQVGDVVVVYGTITKYNSTYEFGTGSQLYSLDRPVVPTILTADDEISELAYVTGNGPSAAQTFTVSGRNLTADITLALSGSNFEMSLSKGSGYTNSLTLTQTAGAVDETTVYVRLKEGLEINDYAGTITLTSAGATDKTIDLTGSVTPTLFTWDLSTDQTNTATENEMTWVGTYATMEAAKASSTTKTNNYYPGTSGQSYKSTRFYTNSTLTITPASGYMITRVEFTATSENYATALANSTWTNATAAASEKTVTVTPTDGVSAITATIGATCGFTAVKVYYQAATYTRPVTADKWGTLCLPYDATVTGATLYTFEGVDDKENPTTVYFEEAASVEAGKPYFFKATGETLTATYTSGVAQEAGSAKGAIGTLEDMDVAEGNYLLSNNELVKCGTGCTLAANRVYVDMTAASVYSGGGAVKMGVDLTDGISVVDAQSANATAFDLSGRRVVKPTKGLYIVNGKKVVIK